MEWIVIDEIQRAPRLLDVVHRLIELAGKRFVLTGSSGRKLRRGASNLLAGRDFVYNLYPLTVPELGSAFRLADALQWGTLPRLFSLQRAADKQAYLRAYPGSCICRDIAGRTGGSRTCGRGPGPRSI